jgi:anaerobic selenocysteine-containing dehydrogenase
MYEREEPFASFGRKVYRRQRVLEPRGEARSDWRIVFELAVELGLGDQFWNGDTRAAMDWILRRTAGIGYEDVPVPEGKLIPPPGPEEFRKYERGMLRRDGRPGFPTPTGKVEVWSTVLERHGFDPLPVYVEPPFLPSADYPLILMTALRDPLYTTGRHKWESSWVRDLRPDPVVDVNPEDADARGISEGDAVTVVTPRGRLMARAHVTYTMLSGVIGFYPGWSDDPRTDVNAVLPRVLDPVSGYPNYTYICELRRGWE